MARTFTTNNSANQFLQPYDKDGKILSLAASHVIIVGGDMAIWDDTAGKFLNENDSTIVRTAQPTILT